MQFSNGGPYTDLDGTLIEPFEYPMTTKARPVPTLHKL